MELGFALAADVGAKCTDAHGRLRRTSRPFFHQLSYEVAIMFYIMLYPKFSRKKKHFKDRDTKSSCASKVEVLLRLFWAWFYLHPFRRLDLICHLHSF